MRISNISTAFLSLLLIGVLSGCTKNFEQYDTNPTSLSNSQTIAILSTAFGPLEQSIYSNYQIAQNLSADAYSGYMMSPNPFKAQYNLNYFLVDSWNQHGFNDQYNLVMGPVSKIAAAGTRTQAPDLWAVALLIQVEAMSRVTDRFGPIPYSKAGSSLISVGYDSQQSVYNQFFSQIDTAVANLKAYIAKNPGKKPLGSSDLIYGGDYVQWLKFANSLRLRLAMRIVKADAATAQSQAKTAMSDPGGLLAVPSDDALIAQSGGRNNDVWLVTASYGDNRLGSDLATFLTGYKDPRLPVYAAPATDPALNGKYVGIRIGIAIGAKSYYEGYSSLNTTTNFTQTAPQYIMTAAEMWFLKAEAALRGWPGAGLVQANYEMGINTSMQQWGVSAPNYINDAVSVPDNYVDPKDTVNVNSTPALSTITIKWDPSASQEVQLERIITQKWLAIFPDGQEAWADYRRTGYPRLFPVVNNFSGGTIDTKIQIRRLAFPQSEYTNNGAAVNSAVQSLLGGADNGGTRVWWDVNKGNF
jgi:SusD/RagB-like outer membrane lipoprotein